MILTTTPTIEGRAILEYRGFVFGEVISGVNYYEALNNGMLMVTASGTAVKLV